MSKTVQPNAVHTRISGALRGVLILMVVSVAINYIDRGSLSTAVPLLEKELALSPMQLGILLSAFFWTYSFLQIVSGWLADRYDVKWVMAIGFLVWSVAAAATGLVYTFSWSVPTVANGVVHAFGLLLVFRLLLGVGESVAFPCYSKIIARNYAEHQRGLANALIDAGGKVGPALGTLAGGVLMSHCGWRPVFIVLGLGSLLWLPAWFKWVPRQRQPGRIATSGGPGFVEILSQRSAWATFMGHFCGNYLWYFLLTWLPGYLVKERGFSMDTMAVVGSLAFFVTATATTITGWLADRAIAAGSTPTRIRKTCTITGLAFATVILAVVVVPGSFASMAFLMFACLS